MSAPSSEIKGRAESVLIIAPQTRPQLQLQPQLVEGGSGCKVGLSDCHEIKPSELLPQPLLEALPVLGVYRPNVRVACALLLHNGTPL